MADWTIREDVAEVISHWYVKVPTMHRVGSGCAGRLIEPGEVKPREFAETELAANKVLEEKGEDRTYIFCARCCVRMTAAAPVTAPNPEDEVELDLSKVLEESVTKAAEAKASNAAKATDAPTPATAKKATARKAATTTRRQAAKSA